MPKLLGEKLLPYVQTQILIRQVYHGSGVSAKRTPLPMSILNSKTAWVKLASGLEIDEVRLREENLQDRFAGRALAREHVLFNGISSLDQENDKLIQRGTVPPNNLFSSINGVYTVNPTNNPYTGFGAVPMPGIESIDVKALNRGSIKESTVKIAAYSPEQFRVIDLLYLRIGYTVFLEWGWSHYIDNSTFKLGNDIVSFIDSKEGFFKENYWNKDGGGTYEMLDSIMAYRKRYSGNWDGFLGRVTNFSWTIDENGKYDITLKLISLGDVIESLKTNLSPTSEVAANVNAAYASFKRNNDESTSDVTSITPINNSLSAYFILNLVFLSGPEVNVSNPPSNREITIGSAGVLGKTLNKFFGGSGLPPMKLKGQFIFDEKAKNGGTLQQYTTIGSGWTLPWNAEDEILDKMKTIYGDDVKEIIDFRDFVAETTPGTYYCLMNNIVTNFVGELFGDDESAARANAKQLIIDSGGFIDRDFVFGDAGMFLKTVLDRKGLTTAGQTLKDMAYFNYNLGDNKGQGAQTVNEQGLYIRLGHLLSYIDKYIIPYQNGNKNNKILKIDTDDKFNLMYTLPFQVSLDPRVCLIRGRIETNNHIKSYFPEFPNFQVPTDNPVYDSFPEGQYLGYTMNIYVNCLHITSILNSNTNKKGDINLFKFLTTVCDDISKALGGINTLEPAIDEETNVLQILDQSLVKSNDKKEAIFQIFGYNKTEKGTIFSNFVRDFSIKTELTNNFATMASVGSTAAGYVKGTENTMFSKWNKGLIDPFKEKLEIEQDVDTKDEDGDEQDPAILYLQNFLEKKYPSFGLSSPTSDGSGGFFTKGGDQPGLAESEITNNISTVTEFYKYFSAHLSKISAQRYNSPSIGFIPISLDLKFDGISGIKIYNSINVDTKFLPPNYTKNLNFIIKNVDHSVKDSDWETSIKTIVVANSLYAQENGEYTPVFTKDQIYEEYKKLLGRDSLKAVISSLSEIFPFIPPPSDPPGGSPGAVNPDEVCGLASANTVDEVYPRSKKWRNGPQPVIIPISKSPSVTIDLLAQPTKKFERTYVSYSEYKKAATKVIKQISPSINSSNLKKVVTAALAVSIIEQGSGDRIKGFNNNLTGVESSGFKVFKKSDVNGKVFATEGGTGLKKAYYSFKSVEAGLVPLISKIIQRNMFAQNGEANEFAWRYYRDWNGYGARTKTTYSGDCAVISRIEKVYAKAAANV